ncbi:hypothetical protein QQS21_009749, partial [Conoideocrella luteorostrata]
LCSLNEHNLVGAIKQYLDQQDGGKALEQQSKRIITTLPKKKEEEEEEEEGAKGFSKRRCIPLGKRSLQRHLKRRRRHVSKPTLQHFAHEYRRNP